MTVDMLDDDDSINGINIAPLVDICLVLLLVFMVTMPLSGLYGITVKENVLRKYGITTPQEHVMIHLTSRGIFVEDDRRREQLVPYTEVGVVIYQLLKIAVVKDVMLK